MNEFIWGIIGPGKIAGSFVEDLQFAKTASHSVGAVVSHNPGHAKEFATQNGIPRSYESIDEFLRDDKINAVYIATPHTKHYKEALICLENELPVLCEKPMGINALQVNDMIKCSAERNVFLMEGMWIRFIPSIKRLLQIIEEGTIGEIVSLKANLSYKAPYDLNSRYFNPALGGGSLLDLGIYPVFLSQWLLGKPVSIKAVAQLSPGNIDEDCRMICEYANGANSYLESSLIVETDQTVVISGKKGIITLPSPWNEKTAAITVQHKGGEIISYPQEWNGRGFQYEAEEVCDCINNNWIESTKMNHQLSYDVISMLDEIRKQTGIKYPDDDII